MGGSCLVPSPGAHLGRRARSLWAWEEGYCPAATAYSHSLQVTSAPLCTGRAGHCSSVGFSCTLGVPHLIGMGFCAAFTTLHCFHDSPLHSAVPLYTTIPHCAHLPLRFLFCILGLHGPQDQLFGHTSHCWVTLTASLTHAWVRYVLNTCFSADHRFSALHLGGCAVLHCRSPPAVQFTRFSSPVPWEDIHASAAVSPLHSARSSCSAHGILILPLVHLTHVHCTSPRAPLRTHLLTSWICTRFAPLHRTLHTCCAVGLSPHYTGPRSVLRLHVFTPGMHAVLVFCVPAALLTHSFTGSSRTSGSPHAWYTTRLHCAHVDGISLHVSTVGLRLHIPLPHLCAAHWVYRTFTPLHVLHSLPHLPALLPHQSDIVLTSASPLLGWDTHLHAPHT